MATNIDAITASLSLLFLVLQLLSICAWSLSSNISLGSSLFTNPTRTQNSYWLSVSGIFAFGFYRLSNDTPSFVVGIWFAKTTEKTLVWVANRDDPPFVAKGTSLHLTQTGKLVVHNSFTSQEKVISNTIGGAAWASMLDSGNFVLYDSNSSIIWESFDFPTDTILGGQRLKNNGSLYSSASETSHATGRYLLYMQVDNNLCMYPDAYYASGTNAVGYKKEMYLDLNGGLYLVNSTSGAIKDVLRDGDNSTIGLYIHRGTIGIDGNFRLFAHRLDENNIIDATKTWAFIKNPCSVPQLCGNNSYCDLKNLQLPTCRCPLGFNSTGSVDQLFQNCDWSFRDENCNNTRSNATMETLKNVEWANADYKDGFSVSEEQCRNACEDNCDCMYAVYKEYKCALAMKNDPFKHGWASYSDNAAIGFFKVRKLENASTPGISHHPLVSNTMWILIITLLAITSLVFLALSGFWILKGCLRIQQYREFTAYKVTNDVGLRRFTYRELHEATGGFREELGRGSFGSVYGGTLFDDVKIAVKKLHKKVKEGERQFQTEMNIIGKTHHRNLVRLLGYCDGGSNRLLVYEFMSNGSLADLIFKEGRKPTWDERVKISLDIASGLAYLHEECETQIIHCDIKPANILLNDSWVPKISDFGLSKLLEPYQTRTRTGPRGTFGYIAPEWTANAPITFRVDVYSFGVMLLEIICCRKSVMVDVPDNEIILFDWVYDCFSAGKLEKLIAPEEVDGGIEKRRLERMVLVGLWCIQNDPILRPTMQRVVLMLEGTEDVLAPPHPTR